MRHTTVRIAAHRRDGIVRLGLAILMGTLLPAATALADNQGFYIETINRTSGMAGQGPSEERTKTYLAHDKMKVVHEGTDATDMIMDPSAGLLTFVNHGAKQYLSIDINAVMEGMSGPAAEQMQAMIGEMTVAVEPTGETKKLGDWNTTHYRVSKTGMVGIEQDVWATEDVAIDVSRYTDMMSTAGPGSALANSPAGLAQRAEMAKIKGYPILTKTKMQMMGTTMETETEVTLIREEEIPADVFTVPADYTLKEMSMGTPPPGTGHP
jgi:hypothetical protein